MAHYYLVSSYTGRNLIQTTTFEKLFQYSFISEVDWSYKRIFPDWSFSPGFFCNCGLVYFRVDRIIGFVVFPDWSYLWVGRISGFIVLPDLSYFRIGRICELVVFPDWSYARVGRFSELVVMWTFYCTFFCYTSYVSQPSPVVCSSVRRY